MVREPVDEPAGEIVVIDQPGEDPWVRAREAHTKIVEGASWETIVHEFEYASVEIATADVRAYLSYVHVMTGDDERQVAKRIELDRLDELHRQWWPLAAVGKDKDAAKVVLEVAARRAKLLELENMSQRQMGDQTIIITGGGNMADELRAIALRNQPRELDAPAVALPPPQDVEPGMQVLD